MEDMKNLTMEGITGMDLEDLDKVAGGFDYSALNAGDREQYDHLGNALKEIYQMPESPYKTKMMRELINTMNQFRKEMEKKYGV